MPPTTVSSDQPIPEFDRRPRAVLVGDIVGYSRMMEAAELETHARCRALRVSISDPAIVSHRGEVIKSTGDGFIALFESPRDAVQCATELQREITNHQSSEPEERRIMFRMGAHWEPVILDANDVFGGGVNIAVRLQEIASPGGIVVSSALLKGAGDVRNLNVSDLGELRLRHLSRPIRGFAIRPAGDTGTATSTGPAQHAAITRAPSVAVLPLANLSPEPADAYFAEGFVEDIIVTLCNLPDLLVISRGSTLAFRRRAVDPAKVSEKLGVRYVVTGSIRRTGKRSRISVELVDVATTSVLWAQNYDIELAQIFDVQDDIALEIVAKIATYVRRSEVESALRKPPQNLSAYDCLLRALDMLYRLDFANFLQVRRLLEKACDEDPGYAMPYAFLACWHIFNIAEGWSSDVDADAAEMVRLSGCAIERDPCNAIALAIHGHARSMFFRDYDTATDLFDRALAVSPNCAWAWVFSSGTYGFIGNAPSGIARAERAIRLSPLDQFGFFNFGLLGQNHYLNGSYEDAIRWSRKALNLNPRFGNAARVLAASLVATGRKDEASTVVAHHTRILPRFRVSDYARRCPFIEPLATQYVKRLEEAGIPV
jgi:adenylate cyclase